MHSVSESLFCGCQLCKLSQNICYVGHSVAKWGGLCTSVPVRLICANCSLNVEVIVEHIPPISSTGLLNSRSLKI